MKTELDAKIIQLLKANSRLSVTDIAKTLGVSRNTVNDRISRLEQKKIIRGYTIKVDSSYDQHRVSAYLMISIDPKQAPAILRQLEKRHNIDAVSTISGQYDLIAHILAADTEQLDDEIDVIANLAGVEKTLTHIVLSKKIDR